MSKKKYQFYQMLKLLLTIKYNKKIKGNNNNIPYITILVHQIIMFFPYILKKKSMLVLAKMYFIV